MQRPIVQAFRWKRLGPDDQADGVRRKPCARDRDGRGLAQGLVHHAVAFGEPLQRVELLLGGVAVYLERQPDALKPYRGLLGNTERPAKIQIAFGIDDAAPEGHANRGRDGAHGHTGARGQRFQQHVARAGECAGAASRRVQARFDERLARANTAGDAVANFSASAQGHERGAGLDSILVFQRGLQRAQIVRVHHDVGLLTRTILVDHLLPASMVEVKPLVPECFHVALSLEWVCETDLYCV